MDQKTAIVTGSSNGIGEAIVKRLAELDYKLVVTGRNKADIKRVAEECANLSPSKSRPLEVMADFEHEAEVERLFQESMAFLGNKLNLLVNNAGIGQPVEHTQPEACFASYKRTIQVNLNSVVQLTTFCAEALKSAAELSGETSCVINIGSIAGIRPTQSLAAYSTSKAGLAMYSKSMAIELAPLIRVNIISPGPVETKIIERAGFSLQGFREICKTIVPLGRIGYSDEVAEAALFLADSKRACYVTGVDLVLDGGAVVAPLRWVNQ